jgi:hypothetical protein
MIWGVSAFDSIRLYGLKPPEMQSVDARTPQSSAGSQSAW